jgi:type IV secretory pathway TrbL component
MKLNKKILNSSLVIMLALGLGGCAVSSAPTTHKASEATSAKVVKQSSKKNTDKSAKADNKAATQKSASQTTSTSSSVSSAAASSTPAANVSSASAKESLAATTKTTSEGTAAINNKTAQTATSKVASQQKQEVQLGLGDVASWTDDNGTTHHVDSDGMDRYTTKGSQDIQYQDWSGSLPQNAVVSHNN